MASFPFYMDIKDRHCLIVGGGTVALRRVRQIRPYGPVITVVAPSIHPDIYIAADKVLQREFKDTDLSDDADFVVAASNDPDVNHHIAALCREKRIPVNVADDKEYSTFFFPAILKKGKLSVGISTSGVSPVAASWLRDRIAGIVPENFDKILDKMEEERINAKRTIEDEKEREEYLTQRFFSLVAGINGDEGGKSAEDAQVILVGAGCGTIDWLTIEGLKAIKSCDALVYDDLIDDSIIAAAPENTEKIYMGKRGGHRSVTQDEINTLLIKLAREGKRTVRLKGGDPFVFGRGGEEILALKEAGVTWRVVPGISSAIAIPEEYGIPVTQRGQSRSVTILTAHTSEDKLRADIRQFAALSGTLVILMGMADLDVIVETLLESGSPADTPIAILSGGNSPNPYKITGRLGDILKKAGQESPGAPGVIVIGSVAGLDLMSQDNIHPKCLIGLTGTDEFQKKLKKELLPLGYGTVSLMEGRAAAAKAALPFDEITDGRKKWLVFTSARSVSIFFQECRRKKTDLRGFSCCRFAVIGRATGEELEKNGFLADLCPAVYNSMSLEQELLRRKAPDEEVWLFCSAQGHGFIHLPCRRYDVYETEYVCKEQDMEVPDILIFGSAGAVRAMKESGADISERTDILCIGPVCRKAVSDCFGKEAVMADEASVEKLVQAVENIADERRQDLYITAGS